MDSCCSRKEVCGDVPFVRIFVQPEEGPLQLTFDNHGTNNYWSYHPETVIPHATESFKIEPVGGDRVMIVGTTSPRGQRWVLTVREDPEGGTDRYPRFRPEEDINVGDSSQHTEFTLLENPDGSIAFSFQTTRDSKTVYFVPTSNRLQRIETKVTDEAEYVFRRNIFTDKKRQVSTLEQFHQILVQPESGPLQATFDNSGRNNSWSYHTGSFRIHITEYFQIEHVGEDNVMIVGLHPPRKSPSRWILTVGERDGIIDRFPRFRPENESDVGNDTVRHTEFIFDENPDGNFSLSFNRTGAQTVYLVPTSNLRQRIKTKERDEMEDMHVFRRGEYLTKEKLQKISWEVICEDTENEEQTTP